jgi:hypothetical protein
MTTKKETLLACPVCHKAEFLRTNVMQDVDVTVDEAGGIKNGFDFSSLEIDDSGEFFCSQCGSHLRLRFAKDTHELALDE